MDDSRRRSGLVRARIVPAVFGSVVVQKSGLPVDCLLDDVSPEARQFVFVDGVQNLLACADLYWTIRDASQHVGLCCQTVPPPSGTKTVNDGQQHVVLVDAYVLPYGSPKWIHKDPGSQLLVDKRQVACNGPHNH